MTRTGALLVDPDRVRAEARSWGLAEVELHASVASTNDLGRDMLLRWRTTRGPEQTQTGVSPLGLVLAAHQEAGRGRSASVWSSPSGLGLWMSFVAPLHAVAERSLLPLRVGGEVIAAVEQLTGARCGWKWPNDIFLGGRKLAGILCEGFSEGVVVGIGINVQQQAGDFPDALRPVATSLHREGHRVDAFDLLSTIVAGLRRVVDRPVSELGDDLLEVLGSRDILAGQPIAVGAVAGNGAGITRQGLLRVESAGRMVTVSAGHVRLAPVDDRNLGET